MKKGNDINPVKQKITSKIFKSVFLGLVFLFVTSWFYKLICLLFATLVWKSEICRKISYPHAYKMILLCFGICFLCVMPRYRYQTNDRVQLIYQNSKGEAILPPLSHYLLNVVLPEEEIMNLCVWGVRFGTTCFPYVGGAILKQFQMDDHNWKIWNFYRPYSRLNWNGLFMMSGITSQVCNMVGMERSQSVYLIKPKHFDKNKKYPLVFFCHGGLGNWKLYQGLWKDLEDCIVLSVGTHDWSGIFGYQDIRQLFTRQLPFLKKLGYQIDESQLHIMGLSNGGTAVNIAYSSFAKRFKSITFLSTGIHQTFPVGSKIVMLGGGMDGSSSSLPSAYNHLKKQGSKAALYWDQNETHFILVNQQDEVLDFLNKELLNH